MKRVLRICCATALLALVVPLGGCLTSLNDPAAFLTQAAEAKGKISDATLGNVAKALDLYCASVPSMARHALREELASQSKGNRLVIQCKGDSVSMLLPPADLLQPFDEGHYGLTPLDPVPDDPDMSIADPVAPKSPAVPVRHGLADPDAPLDFKTVPIGMMRFEQARAPILSVGLGVPQAVATPLADGLGVMIAWLPLPG